MAAQKTLPMETAALAPRTRAPRKKGPQRRAPPRRPCPAYQWPGSLPASLPCGWRGRFRCHPGPRRPHAPDLPRTPRAHTHDHVHTQRSSHRLRVSGFDRIVVHRIVGGVGEGHDRAAVSRAHQWADQWPWKSSCLPTLPNMTLATPCVLVLRPKPALYLTSSAISYPSPGFRP